jgi:hypothetical protein
MRIASPRKALAGLAAAAALVGAGAAVVHSQSRSRVTPYLEIEQVLNADLNEGDVLTYTSIGAGVNANIATRRVQATISYNYQRRIPWQGNLNDEDVHSGLAAAQIQVVPGVLTFDAGAMATRSHTDILTPVPNFRTADNPNLVELYSVYAGPTLSTHVGPLDVGASYRLGYVAIDDHDVAGGGTPSLDRYGHSTIHSAAASVGMGPGQLPFGWTVGAGWSREESDRLNAHNDSKFVRGDVVVPVGHSLALTGGAGYETLKASQQDIRRDSAGLPIVIDGELVADPTKPRLLAYDQSGLIWDVGVIWRPSQRTELQARVGRRYGGTTYTGSLRHKISEAYAVTASVYDNVTSFGRLLIMDMNGLPVNFQTARRNPMSSGFGGVGGCVFGQDPGTGACFDDALQSINSATFRNRGANVMLSGGRGPWTYGVGASYSNRRYFAPPGSGQIFSRDQLTDQSIAVQATLDRRLSRNSGLSFDGYIGWFDPGQPGASSSWGTGITAAYQRTIFSDRVSATLAGGIYHVDSDDLDSTVASVLFGLRYSF